MPTPPPFRSASRTALTTVALLALAFVVRGGVLWFTPGAFTSDPDSYQALAANLLERGTFGLGDAPTAYRPPLYPLLLVPSMALGDWSRVAIGLLHLAIGLATVWLTERLGRRWGLGNWSVLAAVLVACDPILLHQSTLAMTETLAALLAVVALVLLTAAAETPSPLRAAAAGAALGLAALCRPTFLVWAALVAVLLPWFAATWKERLKVFSALVVTVLVVLSPWIVRNQIHFGRPIASTTHGGFTLLLGNNPGFYQYLREGRWGSLWDADQFNAVWVGRAPWSGPGVELANDRQAYAEAWQQIADEPGMFLYACLVRVGRLWQPLPHQGSPAETPTARWLRYGIGFWYLGELALAAIGLAGLIRQGLAAPSEPGSAAPFPGRRGPTPTRGSVRRTWLWGLLLVLSFTAVHTLYWTNMRMRAPLMPVVALTAVAALGRLRGEPSRCKAF
jgi:4-amino-4-deoxy-L-arabinose transferase-like glycosyltransferase